VIITLEDDGLLHLYESLEAVTLAIEALDAEGTLRAVFDEAGQRFTIDWVRPNDEGLLGLTNGEYRLVPAGAPDPGVLLEILSDTPVFPEAHQGTVDRIRQDLLARL
jgi:hypothetical protein